MTKPHNESYEMSACYLKTYPSETEPVRKWVVPVKHDRISGQCVEEMDACYQLSINCSLNEQFSRKAISGHRNLSTANSGVIPSQVLVSRIPAVFLIRCIFLTG